MSSRGVLGTGLDVLPEFSHLNAAVALVAEAVTEARPYLLQSDANVTVELEGRLGFWSDRGFVSDVGHSAFCAILRLLESFEHWHHTSGWLETQDVYYVADLPCGDGKTAKTQVRTSVGLDADRKLALQHTVKRKVKTVDLKVASLGACGASSLPSVIEALEGPSHARLCISLEQRVPSEMLPIAVSPTLVRIKQRKRFSIASLGVEKAAFAVDMTIVYAGGSKSEAEQKQARGHDPSHEVEVECLEPLAYLHSCNQQSGMLALSMVLKLLDFVAALNPKVPVTFLRS